MLMDVVLLIAQKQDEEGEEEEGASKDGHKELLGGAGQKPEKVGLGDSEGEDKDETDTQKLAKDMGLNPAQSSDQKDPEPERDGEGKLDFNQFE